MTSRLIGLGPSDHPSSPSKGQSGVLQVMDRSATRIPSSCIMGRHPRPTGSPILPLYRGAVSVFYSPSRQGDVRFVLERENSIENKNKRSLFCSKLLNYQSTGKPILFMDETNFNLHISRRDGYSLKCRRCNVVSAGTQGANIHVIGCIGPHGLMYHEIQRGSFRKESAVLDARMFESCKETIWGSSCDGC